MKNTSLCYIIKDDCYLLLHKTVKKDENFDKWLGIGGKFLPNEGPFDCVRREVLEETGLTLVNPQYRGIITFVNTLYETEQMHLFTCGETDGSLCRCDEGELLFVPRDKMLSLPHWEGDEIFLELLKNDASFFSLKLVYDADKLVSHELHMI